MRRPTLFLLAAAFPLLLYARTLTFDFVHADDVDLIAGNQAFLSDLRNVPRAFGRSYFETEGEAGDLKTYYRPAAIVSFMVDAARAGADPGAYHATNVVLHALATCLLLALAQAWGAPPLVALGAALVFAAHPVNVQAVAWIAGRNDLLLAVFGLLALLGWARLANPKSQIPNPKLNPRAQIPITTPNEGGHWLGGWPLGSNLGFGIWALGFHTLFFACALFSKETGVFFPLVAVLHQRVAVRASLTRAQWTALTADGAIVIVWAWLRAQALAGPWVAVAEGGGASPGPSMRDTLAVAVANAPQLLVQIGKWLVPARLNVSPGVDAAALALGVVALVTLVRFAWRAPARGMAIAGACWALAFLLPTLLVPGLPAYEHRNYVPLIGVLIALCAGSKEPAYDRKEPDYDRMGGRPTVPRFRRPQLQLRLSAAIIAMVIAVFATRTYQRLEVFEDPFAYWSDAARDPQFAPIAHVNLGQLHELQDRPEQARREYLRALEIDPATPKAHNNLGVVLMRMDQPEQAVRHFREEVRRHPSNAEAWYNLGLVAERRGDEAAARRNYERAIAENRFFRPAYEKLGRAEQIPNPKSQIPK